MDHSHQIGSGQLDATINAQGAELSSLRHDGHEYLWQAGPAWPRRAPILFPIVGRLPDDRLRHGGAAYPMTQHGFARDCRFEWVERSPTGCRLALADNDSTRAAYPFRFRLEAEYRVAGSGLTIELTVCNVGDGILPASVGLHPAFQWPLPGSADKAAHTLAFDHAEANPIRSVSGGLLQTASQPSPVVGQTLALRESLFSADALIFDQLASSSVRYTAPRCATLEVSWRNCPFLGIWSKPGGDFLCIEPWHGISTPLGFDADFAAKPGLMLIEPGARRSIGITVAVLPPTGRAHD